MTRLQLEPDKDKGTGAGKKFAHNIMSFCSIVQGAEKATGGL